MPSIGERLTAKAGPLPVWGWAVVLLVGGYLAYRFVGSGGGNTSGAPVGGASSDTGSTADSSLIGTGGSDGSPPGTVDTGGGGVDLTGLQSSVDSLTAAVQMSPAFWPTTGDAGSGSFIPNDGSAYVSAPSTATSNVPPKATSVVAASPKAGVSTTTAARASAVVRYYTFAPGKAPTGRKGDEAPARGPSGTTLHFAQGKGYYYA